MTTDFDQIDYLTERAMREDPKYRKDQYMLRRKKMFIMDCIILILSLLFGFLSFFMAKYIFVRIEFTILGAMFMTLFGMIIGGNLYYFFLRRKLD